MSVNVSVQRLHVVHMSSCELVDLCVSWRFCSYLFLFLPAENYSVVTVGAAEAAFTKCIVGFKKTACLDNVLLIPLTWE